MKDKIFFKGLNEIRALAALAVVFHHVELYKYREGDATFMNYHFLHDFLMNLGKNGVFIFFVLSGFLITYLLLVERESKGSISIKKFYIRRALRIWPLYFLVLIIGFFVMPFVLQSFPTFFAEQDFYNERINMINHGGNLLMCLLFLSNLSPSFFPPVVGFAQSWSVSVEEQFYLIWPWIFRWSKKKIVPLCLSIIVGMNLLHWMSDSFTFLKNNILIYSVLHTFHIDYMAMGGLAAFYYKKGILQKYLKNKLLFGILLFSFLLQLFNSWSNVLFSANIALLILYFIEMEVEIKPLNFLGKISYGIYMFHPVLMYISFAILKNMNLNGFLINNLVIYTLILGFTIGLSYLSYRYFEQFFLRLKDKFAPIKSSNS